MRNAFPLGATFVALTIACGPCSAWTGNDLIGLKTRAGEAGRAAVIAYAEGVLDFESYLVASARHQKRSDLSGMVCVRRGVTPEQAGAVLMEYLDAHPDVADTPAAAVAHTAFLEAWPCNGQ